MTILFRPALCKAVLAAALLSAAPARAAGPMLGPETDRHIQAAMQAWNVPGLAIAVIHRGKVIYNRTFGYRDVARRRKVTPRTMFAIGSVTKSFTVAGLAVLVYAGKLDWDRPAREYLPVFAVRGERHTSRILVRDLVSHRTGLPRHDALWYFDAHSRPELVRRLRYLSPVAEVGARYGYHNLMVVAAGYLAGKVAESTWEKHTRTSLLDPLGMSDTRLSLNAFLDSPDRAEPYFPTVTGVTAIRHRSTDVIGPAASVYSDLRDMTRWLRFQLEEGTLDGLRILPRAAMLDMRRPRIRTGAPVSDPSLGPESYGMGFFIQPYRRNMVVRHPGVIDGYSALLSMMPRRETGIVILTNLSGNNDAPTAVERYVYDRILGLSVLPWIAKLKAAHAARMAELSAKLPRVEPPRAKRPADPMKFAGTYLNPAYGAIRLEIGNDGESLEGVMHGVRFVLRHHDRWEWRVADTAWPLRAGLSFRFRFDTSGKAYRLSAPLADGPDYRLKAGPIVFVREGARAPAEHYTSDPAPPLADRIFR